MIWFWVLIWVEVVGGDGSGNGCGQWWLVAMSMGSGGGFRFCSGFFYGGWWLEFVIGDFLFCL